MFVFATALVMIIGGLLSGVVQLASRPPAQPLTRFGGRSPARTRPRPRSRTAPCVGRSWPRWRCRCAEQRRPRTASRRGCTSARARRRRSRAAKIVPSSSATASACSSTTGPRARVHENSTGLHQREATERRPGHGASRPSNGTERAPRRTRCSSVVEVGDPSRDAGVVTRVVQHLHPEPCGAWAEQGPTEDAPAACLSHATRTSVRECNRDSPAATEPKGPHESPIRR